MRRVTERDSDPMSDKIELTIPCPQCGTDALWTVDLHRIGDPRTTMYAGAIAGQDMRPQAATTTIRCETCDVT